MIDVLIAGGGPAGLATAIRCAQAGLSVTVAEPRAAPIDKACGEGLMPSAVARLAALGVRPAGHPLRGIRYLDASHRVDARFRHGDGLGVRRTTLHAALAARAAELSIPVLPVRVTSVTQDGGGVTAAGLRARYLVAADGLHSTVRRTCGLDPPRARRRGSACAGTTGSRRGPTWSRCTGRRGPRRTSLRSLTTWWASRSWAARMATSRPGSRRSLRCASASPDPGLAARCAARARCGRTSPRRSAGNVLLVGDASGYLDALTGEGIGAALAQAAVLAECLAAGRPGDYERAWRRACRRSWMLTAGLLWSRHQPLLGPRIVPAAQRLPRLFTTIVNLVGDA